MRTIAIVALFPLLLLSSSPARAHAYLDHASPRVGATVASSPGQVMLYFSQKLESKFSKAEVRNAAGARVDQGSSVSGSVITVGVQDLPDRHLPRDLEGLVGGHAHHAGELQLPRRKIACATPTSGRQGAGGDFARCAA